MQKERKEKNICGWSYIRKESSSKASVRSLPKAYTPPNSKLSTDFEYGIFNSLPCNTTHARTEFTASS